VTSDFDVDEQLSSPLLSSKDINAIEEWSATVAAYYCCQLRSGETDDLIHASFEFPEMCLNPTLQIAFKHVLSEVENDISNTEKWTRILMDFCPNNAVPEQARSPSHFSSLYDVTIETKHQNSDQTKKKAIHDCRSGESNGDDLVDFTILLPTGSVSDWQHVVAFWGDELTVETYIDWMPNLGFNSWWTLATQAEYSLINGIDGHFRSPVKLNLASGIRISGLKKKAILETIEAIKSEGRYDVIFNNCAHQIARIAKAGLECDIRKIPFLLPQSVKTVAVEIGQELSIQELKVIQAKLDEIGEDETFTISRLMRRSLMAVTQWFN